MVSSDSDKSDNANLDSDRSYSDSSDIEVVTVLTVKVIVQQ